MGSETLPSACYILSDESSIPFYYTSNGYNKKKRYSRWPRILNTRYSAKNRLFPKLHPVSDLYPAIVDGLNYQIPFTQLRGVRR